MIPTPLLATSIYVHLPIMIVLISLVYSATRFERWDNILKEAFRWGLRMGAFLCGIALLLYITSLFI
jgi:hypothetical protein